MSGMFLPREMLRAPELYVPWKKPIANTILENPFSAKWTHWNDFQHGWINKVTGVSTSNNTDIGPRWAFNTSDNFNRYGSYTGFKKITATPFFIVAHIQSVSNYDIWIRQVTADARVDLRLQGSFGSFSMQDQPSTTVISFSNALFARKLGNNLFAGYFDFVGGHVRGYVNGYYQSFTDTPPPAPSGLVDNSALFLQAPIGKLHFLARGEGHLTEAQFLSLASNPYQFLHPA